MNRLLALIFVLFASPAIAQDIFPALYDVTGVAADDVLNVRADPSARSDIIGAFGPLETAVEVIALSDDGRWGQVNTGEQAGWTAMRFLARQSGQTAEDWSTASDSFAPRDLECFGTEPFWTLNLMPGGTMAFSARGESDGSLMHGSYRKLISSAGLGKRGFSGSVAEDGALMLDATFLDGILTSQFCTDGMSDQVFGLSIDLVRSHFAESKRTLTIGCCTLVP